MIDLEEKQLFIFNLQHHADGEGGAEEGGAHGETGGDEFTEETGGDEGFQETDQSEESGKDPLVLPERFGLKDGRLEYIEDDEGKADTKEEKASDTPEKGGEKEKAATPDKKEETPVIEDGAKKPSFYSPEEIYSIAAKGVSQLDPTRISPEALPLYRELVNLSAQNAAKDTKPSTKEQEKAAQDAMEAEISALAMNVVSEELKKNGEEFDEYNFTHQQKYYRAVARLERDLERSIETQNRQKQEQQSVFSAIKKEFSEYQTKDKDDFKGIDETAATRWQKLPYEKAAPVAEALQRLRQGQPTQADVPVLRSYWEDCRREYFAKKTGVTREAKPVPPKLQKPGSGQDDDKAERFDAKKIGTMTQEERIDYYKRTKMADKLGRLS